MNSEDEFLVEQILISLANLVKESEDSIKRDGRTSRWNIRFKVRSDLMKLAGMSAYMRDGKKEKITEVEYALRYLVKILGVEIPFGRMVLEFNHEGCEEEEQNR